MNINNDIKKRLDVARGLLIEIYALYNDVVFCTEIWKKLEASEYRLTTGYDGFLIRYYGLSWSMLVLKLFSVYYPEEDFSLIKFLQILKNNYRKINWKKQLSKSEIDEMLTIFEKPEISLAISSLKEIRDKHLAHLDFSRKETSLITSKQADLLVSTAIEITNKLYLNLFGYTQGYVNQHIVSIEGIYYALLEKLEKS